jgi:two-component system CheB/CheR fusion protein
MSATTGFLVVCMGGSAGGLEAYLAILRHLPADIGMAFVVAQHRPPENAEWLPRILACATTMPVIDVRKGMFLQPNTVYIMPPRIDMTVKGHRFMLRPQIKPHGWPNTISLFLLSLAEAYGPRAIAVILSGMGEDGSTALKAIKAAGGLTFAQSDPEFESMPRHAVETGHIDFILSSVEIARALVKLNEDSKLKVRENNNT